MVDRRRFDDDELHWYALDVVRQKEFVAGYIFNKRGWMTFIPSDLRFRKKTRYQKGKVEVAYPAFPGTVFVGFPESPHWFDVMRLHLVNGVLSIDRQPRRIDTASAEWMRFRSRQLDGQLVLERQLVDHRGQAVERSVALVQVQGRGVIRSPLSVKAKASADRPVVITVQGERARKLGGLLAASADGVNKSRAA